MLTIYFCVLGENGIQLGRFSLSKTFHGDLEGESQGEMLSTLTTEKGLAGFRVVEQVKEKLKGKSGGLVLKHFGIIN